MLERRLRWIRVAWICRPLRLLLRTMCECRSLHRHGTKDEWSWSTASVKASDYHGRERDNRILSSGPHQHSDRTRLVICTQEATRVGRREERFSIAYQHNSYHKSNVFQDRSVDTREYYQNSRAECRTSCTT